MKNKGLLKNVWEIRELQKEGYLPTEKYITTKEVYQFFDNWLETMQYSGVHEE